MAASFNAPRALAVSAALVLSSSCASESTITNDATVDRPQVAQITVSIAATALDKGVTTKATAQLRDAAQNLLTGRAVTWSSSNASVARVDASTGDVTGLAEGAADIIATSEGVDGRAVVTVHISVASVSASLANPVLYVNASTMAIATPRDVDGQPLQRPVTWTSSNTGVADVHPTTGAVTAVGQGIATIAANCEGRVGQTSLTVTSVPVASVTVTLNTASLTVGATTAASAVTRDASHNILTGRIVTWTSSNAAVATVNASGTVTAVSVGSANITATSEGVSGQAALSVTQVPVASVTVTLNASSLTVGANTAAAAVARDAANNVLTGRPVTWSSSNTAIATVNASGLVTAVSVGSANIRATSEGVTGQAALTVSNVPVASVTVTLAAPSIQSGQTTTASAVLRDAANNVLTGRPVTWTSSNTAVATVNASGTVTAVSVGSANITATSEGVSGQAALTVTQVPVASVTVTLNASSLTVGASTAAAAVARDAANNVLTGRPVTWSSSNTAVATVNASGLVTAVSVGSANIRATSEGVTGQAALTVSNVPVASVTVTLASPSIQVGLTTTASAIMRDAANNVLTGRPVTWSSSNTAVATVNSSGSVTAVSVGSANITATSEGISGQAALTVTQAPVASVTVTLNASTLTVGASTAAVAVARDAANNILTGRAVTWTSSNTAVATVNASGTVTAVAVGSANITATSEGVSGQSTITVVPVPVASVTVTLASSSMQVGQMTTASAVTRDAANNVLTGRAIAWSSSNTAVATVNASGTVTAVSTGSANIRATSEGVTGQAALAVTNVPVASVTVTLGSSSIQTGQTTTASAVLRDAANNVLTGRVVTWSSSNTAVATVNASGIVTAVSAGSANIRATSEGVIGQAALTVTFVPVATVTVTLGSSSIQAGQTTTASAVLRDAANNVLTGRVVTWTSSNTGVATVNASGTLTGVAVGSANITATSEGVAGSAGVTVIAAPAAGVIFSSDWGTATGTSSLATGDGGRWTHIGSQPGSEIISSAGLDFPSANVLRVTVFPSGWPWVRKTGLPVPDPGQSRFYRWYTRVAIPDDLAVADEETHPHQDGNGASDYNWGFHIWHDSPTPGRWMPQFRAAATENAYPNYRWGGYSDGGLRGPELFKNRTYRFEMQILRLTATTYNMHVRIYDSAGSLLYDDDDFRNMLGTASLASNPTFTFHNVANLDGLNAGINGLGGTEWHPSVIYMYQGAIAVCANTWCGPYVP